METPHWFLKERNARGDQTKVNKNKNTIGTVKAKHEKRAELDGTN